MEASIFFCRVFQVELERGARERDRKAFLRLERRAPTGRPSDARLMELISAYETQRGEHAREAEALQRELRRLNDNLREKENLILRHGYGMNMPRGLVAPGAQRGVLGDASGTISMSLSGEGEFGEYGGPGCGATSELADKYRAQGRELHVARARAEELAAAAQAQARAAEELRDKISELKVSNRGADSRASCLQQNPFPAPCRRAIGLFLKNTRRPLPLLLLRRAQEERANLKLELGSRPSLKLWHETKAEVAALGRRLVDADRRCGVSLKALEDVSPLS